MDYPIESIYELAKRNARLVKRHASPDSIHQSGHFDILSIQNGQISFLSQNCSDLARYPSVVTYFDLVVLASNGVSLDGYYSICVSDTAPQNDFALDFAKIPDLYQMQNYKGLLSSKDKLSFEEKKDCIVFAGSSTGDDNPAANERLMLCAWGADHTDFCDFHITNYIQGDAHSLVQAYGRRSKTMLSEQVTFETQLESKFILSMDGYGASWDRPIWVMNSNSMLFKMQSLRQNTLWYYPLLIPGAHYVDVTMSTIEECYRHYVHAPQEAKDIISKANHFVLTHSVPEIHVYYTLQLLTHACRV